IAVLVQTPYDAKARGYAIVATGESGQRGVAGFTVTAAPVVTLVVGPTSARAGEYIALKGSGYLAYEEIQVEWGSASGRWYVDYLYANSNGSVSGYVQVPWDNPGAGRFYARGMTSNRSSSAYFVIVAE